MNTTRSGFSFMELLVVILIIANDFALPVTSTFLNNAPGLEPPELQELFDIRIAWGVAAFVFLSSAAHWIIASPGVYGWYRRNLERNRNYARWIEYSVSSSVMVVLIAMLTGISDVAALGGIFGVNTADTGSPSSPSLSAASIWRSQDGGRPSTTSGAVSPSCRTSCGASNPR